MFAVHGQGISVCLRFPGEGSGQVWGWWHPAVWRNTVTNSPPVFWLRCLPCWYFNACALYSTALLELPVTPPALG